jgi:hypothetical protein
MAEVGLLPFARIALQVGKAVLPRFRSRFSKHQFTQPQLLAILCLMRYEDWTFREAEVRLREHRELRQALGLASVPDFTTLYRFLKRLDDQAIDRAVGETVRRLRGTRKKGRRRARVAVDATGLTQGVVSTFFVRRLHHHGQKPLPWRHWLKWVIVADLDQQYVLSQMARRSPGTTVQICPPWSKPLPSKRALGWCWPMPSSTTRGITPIFDGNCERRASSPPNAERKRGAFTGCVPRCGEHFHDNSIAAGL